MTFQQKLIIIATLAALIASAATRPKSTYRGSRPARLPDPLVGWLGVVVGALILVGVVSHTLLRHTVQIVPLVLAGGLLTGRAKWGIAAAAPLFAFWLLLMSAIWLFLAGVARIVSGTFTPAEITLTLIIGIASFFGLLNSHRRATTLSLPQRLGTIGVFAVLQFAALWVSFQPFVARR